VADDKQVTQQATGLWQRFAGQHLVRRCAGLTCGGVHNTYFWIDLKKLITAVALMQIMERQVIYAMLEISA
jgi:hypothetical protein